MGFLFEHKKRTVEKNVGGDFGFTQTKRLSTITHPSQIKPAGYSGGAFDPPSFDVNSFWCGVVSSSTFIFNRVSEFLFKQIKSTR